MDESKLLAVDFGAESGRVILGTLKNQKIKLREIHRFPNQTIKIFENLYWNFLYLYEEMIKGIQKAVKIGHSNIESIAVDTWGVDFGLITKDNQLLGSPYSYRDLRTNGILEIAFELIEKDVLYKQTGIQFMQINTAFQLLSMVKSNNSMLNYADKLLFMPDLFNYFLTGEKKSEYTIASTSQLMNAEEKQWDDEIFASLNLPRNIMSEIIMPGKIIGNISENISERLGLKQLNVIAVGSHDTASAVAAVPNLTNNWAFISSGTWSLIGIESDYPIINKDSFKYNFTNEGSVGDKIKFLRNVMGMWIIQKIKKEWEVKGSSFSYSELNKLALNAIPFKCVIDVDESEFLNPSSMLESINKYCAKTNQNKPSTKGEYIRCVLESLAFKYRLILDQIKLFKKEKIEIINIVGGGSQNDLLNQFTANSTGLKVISGPIEATAFGNIIVQAIANGKIDNIAEGRKIISNSIDLKKFIPDHHETWNEKFLKIKNIISHCN